MPPNHTAGGINMNFFPVGPLVRRAGVFFIRRSFKDNAVYRFVLKQYLDYLLSKRFPLEWFIEGGRSRSGKLREPRFGMLGYVADSYRRGSCDEAVVVPVAIAYDQIHDMEAYTTEQRGGVKEKESLSWLIRAVNSMRRRYGRITVRFGEPIYFSEWLSEYDKGGTGDPDATGLEVQKLAFEVGARINRATPMTPISLVALALLGERDRALTVSETLEALDDFIAYVKRRDLPVTEPLSLDTPATVGAALEALRDHGVVSRFDGGPETVYSIEPEQHLAAAFYRNTIIHFFLEGAIAELALLTAADFDDDRIGAFWREVWRLRDLLKFEFYFADRDGFARRIGEEVGFHRADWERTVSGSRDGTMEVLESIRPFKAHWVLRPFLEAYRVVADALELHDYRRPIDDKQFLIECMALGKQYRLQRRIQSEESVSSVLFATALKLAANRDLLAEGGPEVLDRRAYFALEIRDVIRRIDAIEALSAARRAGLGD
jgi:glycerol-3-phosphate O-acyltransferase